MNTTAKLNRGRKPTILLPEKQTNLVLRTFHYNVSDECVKLISMFAKEHREDKNKQFKMAWKQWIEDQSVAKILLNECEKLKEAGYESDPLEKIYFSTRYYYRKKALKDQTSTAVSETPQVTTKRRKQYESTDKEILEQINQHIIQQLFHESNTDISPANAFNHFMKMNAEEDDIADLNEAKIKKIYKNRFFVLRKKWQTLSQK